MDLYGYLQWDIDCYEFQKVAINYYLSLMSWRVDEWIIPLREVIKLGLTASFYINR